MEEINNLQQAFKEQKPQKFDKQNSKELKPPLVKEVKIDNSKTQNQSRLVINGIEVFFPYKPYEAQIKYMEQVIQALQNRQNGLLQSPTGTGKTLCLLCATLGFLKHIRQIQIKENQKNPIRIIYSSRTHSQLKQVAKELKRTAYLPQMTLLGSRDQYCIKREFQYLKGSVLISSCMKAIKGNNEGINCQYFKGMHYDNSEHFENILFDIEDLRATGRRNGFCPYFYTRRIKDCSDIILLPYNYLLELGNFSVFNIEMQDCIIIFDEAHNIQSVAEEGASFFININMLNEVEKEIAILEDQIINDFKDPNRLNKNSKLKQKVNKLDEIDTQGLRSSNRDCRLILEPVQAFKQFMINLRLNHINQQRNNGFQNQNNYNNNNNNNELGILYQGKEIFPILSQNTKSLPNQPAKTLNNNTMDSYLLKKKSELNAESNNYETSQFTDGLSLVNISQYLHKIAMAIEDLSTTQNWGLDSWQSFLIGVDELLRSSKQYEENQCNGNNDQYKNPINHYKLYARFDSQDPSQTQLNLWCLDPSISFHRLTGKGIFNIMLTSGTITPFNSWTQELKLNFQVTLDNDHVIDVNQNLCAGILKKGPQGKPLNFSYDNRNNEEIFVDLGLAIINLCIQIPAGVLIIFSSYQLLEKTELIWRRHPYQIFNRLNKIKDIFKEPKESAQIQSTMETYLDKIKQNKRRRSDTEKNGAILMAVCRGKISEGIDFTDDLARAVFMVGVPYPPVGEKKIQVKKEYLDSVVNISGPIRSNTSNNNEKIIQFKKLSGKDWYMQQAIRASNQAIGRVIRHKDDYGSIFFCDIRFDQDILKNEISRWVKPVLKSYESFSQAVIANKQFFDFWKKKEENINVNTENEESRRYGELTNFNKLAEDENSKKAFECDSSENNLQHQRGFNSHKLRSINESNNQMENIMKKKKIFGLRKQQSMEDNNSENDENNNQFNDPNNVYWQDSKQVEHQNNNYQDLMDDPFPMKSDNNLNYDNTKQLKRRPIQNSFFDFPTPNNNTINNARNIIMSSLQNNNSKNKREFIDNKSQEFSIQNLINESQEKENHSRSSQKQINYNETNEQDCQQKPIISNKFLESQKKKKPFSKLSSINPLYKDLIQSPTNPNNQQLDDQIREENDQIICQFCQNNPAKKPQQSINCKHVACASCWKYWLVNQQEITCVKCSVRVNEQNLVDL